MTTDTTNKEAGALKPCPFCGSEPASYKTHGVWCNNDACAIVGMIFSGGPRHWNRRAPAEVQAERYEWLRRRAAMVDYSDETVTKLTLFKHEGPTGEFLDDWIDGERATLFKRDAK